MTTIAYSRGILATDSGCTNTGILLGAVRKMVRTSDGHLIAAAGKTLACEALFTWALAGMDGSPGIDDDEFQALLIHPDGTVCLLGGDGTQAQIEAPFHAVGSGYQLALAAMAAGADAEHAVQIACRFDAKSREPVRTMRLEDNGSPSQS